MSSPPWMPLDIDDYMSATGHLTAAEHGAYMLLIMHYWKHGGLPDDERLIQRYARLSQEQWAESRDVIAAFFEDDWKHHRIDAELARAAEIMGKRKAAGKARQAGKPASAEQEISTEPAHAEQVLSTCTPHITNNLSSSLRSDEKAPAPKRGSRLPENWVLPDDWRQDATDVGLPPQRIEFEAARLRDWSRSSANGVKRDWRAAWRNWCRRVASEIPPARGSPPSKPSLASGFMDLARQMERQDAIRSEGGGSGVRPALPDLSAVSGG